MLTKSVAICRYIERFIRSRRCLAGARAKGVRRNVATADGIPTARAGRTRLSSLPSGAGEDRNRRNCRIWRSSSGRALKVLHFLDHELASRPFIAGEAFTIADITGLAAVDLTPFARIDIPTELTNLARWREEVSSAPERQGPDMRLGASDTSR